MTEERILAQTLTRTFGDIKAVDNLSLQVQAGEIYGLVGPDGAGKTTTMRLLCGALLPDSGDVTVGGYSMRKDPDLAREQIGYLSQRFSLYEELTVLENIRFFAEVRGISKTEWRNRSMEILAFVGLIDFVERRAGLLSGGMKQKLGLASALVHNPLILLLDEPTGGVDPVTRQDFWQLIIRLVAEEGVSVLVSTPYMDEAVRCTRVGFMQTGRLIIEDSPNELRSKLVNQIIEVSGEPLRQLRELASADPDIVSVQAFGDRLHLRVQTDTGQQVVARLKISANTDQVLIHKIDVVHPSLEDVFIALLEKNRM